MKFANCCFIFKVHFVNYTLNVYYFRFIYQFEINFLTQKVELRQCNQCVLRKARVDVRGGVRV